MKLVKLIEATHVNQPPAKVIAQWLDMGLAGTGWHDDWDEIVIDVARDTSIEDAMNQIKEYNQCVDFINQILKVKYKHINEKDALSFLEEYA